MRTKYVSVAILLFICSSFLAFKMADDPFETFLKKLADYTREHPQEKVHLHLDKPYYAIGDDIWFKAYVTDNSNDELSQISSAIYVELINEDDSVKKQIKLPLVAGLSWGDFKLTDSLPEGNYRIRAYTEWMRNAGPDFFFDKTIKIGNAWANKVFTSTSYSFSKKNNTENVDAAITFTDKQGIPYGNLPVNYEVEVRNKIIARSKVTTSASGEAFLTFINPLPGTLVTGKINAILTLPNKQKISKSIPIQTSSGAVSVQLFPEGGNLVENLPTKVGIKAVNASGLGEDVEGTVYDNEGTEVLAFKTMHRGLGNFVINPQPGKTYTIKVKLKNGTVQDVTVPKILPEGYVIAVNNSDSSKVYAKILISESLLNKGEMKLLIQHNNTVYAVLKANSTKQITTFSVARKELPAGINRITLFNGDNVPVCERLFFVNNPASLLNGGLTNLKAAYGKRENVTLEFSAKDGAKATQGSFSVAVTNTNIVEPDEDNESNILTSLLLTSDLKGYIEKPNQYLKNDNKVTRENLDNLMLTQGWTRLLWKDVLTNTPVQAPIFAAEKSLKISGTITTTGGKPVPNGKVSLFSTSGGLFMIDTLTDAKGRFTFNNLSFGDSTKFVVQARNAKNKKYVEINLDIVPGQIVTKNKNTGDIVVNVNEAILGYVKKSESYFNDLTRKGLLERSVLLDQVNIVQKKNPASNSSNLNGAGHADAIITAKELGTCVTLSQCLQGRVAGLMIQNGKAFLLRNNGAPMQIILDGMYVEPDFLDNIQPFNVETIEILKNIGNTAIYGSRGSGGVIIITTKRGGGDLSYSRYSPGIITYAPKGYYAVREFYSPQYTPGNTLNGSDRRTTVYWKPHFAPDGNGIAKFNFYNTDESGTYRVVIEGINVTGQLLRKVYTYEVK